jgi:transposase-like protein
MEVVRLIESLQTDTIEFTLMESNEDSSILKIRNKALILDVETGNGRVYPSDVVATAIKEAKERMDNHECLGTVNGHPEDIYPEPDVTSHYVTKAWIEDGYLVTESVVMCNTHFGRTLKGLIESDAAIGVSVRGTGSVTGNRVTSYQFESFDFVGTPSTGLRVKPTILGSTQVESMKNKVVSYIKENNSKCTKTNDMERKQMATMSFPEFKKIMTECIEHVKSAKNLTEANSRIAQVSSKISQLPTVDASTAPFGQESIRGVFKEWEETEFNVVNRAVKTPSEAAKRLGVSDSLLHSWKKTYNISIDSDKSVEKSFAEAEELKRLRKENEELKKINYILRELGFSEDSSIPFSKYRNKSLTFLYQNIDGVLWEIGFNDVRFIICSFDKVIEFNEIKYKFLPKLITNSFLSRTTNLA